MASAFLPFGCAFRPRRNSLAGLQVALQPLRQGAFFATCPRKTPRQPFIGGSIVRWIGWLLLSLLVAGWLATIVPLGDAESDGRLPAWRRTVDGWERPTWSTVGSGMSPPALHPAVVGALEALLTLLALLAFSPAASPKTATGGRGNPGGSHQ